MSNLKGKVALVTGGYSGIGLSVSNKLAKCGVKVVIPHSARGLADAEKAVQAIVEKGGEAITLPGEMQSVKELRQMFTAALNQYGKIDIVVSCAGTIIYKPMVDVTEDEFDNIFSINTRGTFFVMQEAARHISDGGRIIVFSSPGSRLGQAGSAAYGGSKAAIESFTRALAWEVAQREITVNTIWPGVTDTRMLMDSYREIGANMSPFKRLGEPEDVADIVIMLSDKKSSWLTGQIIQAGGGTSML